MSPTSTSSSPGSDPQKPVKRMRTSKPKTKTGCRNCKQRRIKCDEKRPSCTQCARSRKLCTGYPPPAHRARPHEEIRIAPKLAAAPAGPAITPIREPIQLPPRRVVKQVRQAATPPQTPVLQQSSISVALYAHPSPVLSFDIQEGQYFQLFRSNTAGELSGFFDNVFWTRSVLQECHTEAAIKHAVVALGALYKTLEKSTESPPTSPSNDADCPSPEPAFHHWEVAVRQYSNACNALVGVSAQDERSHRTRLMASVLLACFDSFIGDHRQAIVQIQTGLSLLERLRAERRRSFVAKPGEPVEDELVQMFTRLAIQAKSYDMAFHFPEPYVIHLTQQPSDAASASTSSDAGSPASAQQEPVPERFGTLLEARTAWDSLLEQIFRALETMSHYASVSPNLLPRSMMAHGMAFATRIQAWSDAFDPILASRGHPGISRQEKAGIAVLKMFQIMSQVLYLMTFSDSEMQFDRFRAHFQSIVDLALEVVGDEERRAAERRCPDPRLCQHRHPQPQHRHDGLGRPGEPEYVARHVKASFSADLGIVPPLYVVATKSRDPVIRRQAIQLLRSSPRREGMWDSELSARIGHWVLQIEEEDDQSHRLLTPDESPVSGPLPSSAARPPPERPAGPGHNCDPVRLLNQHQQVVGAGPLSASSVNFGEAPLGPGGNARWDSRRESVASTGGFSAGPPMSHQLRKTVPVEKRVMVKSAEFDLREHTAILRCGTRGLAAGIPDLKSRETRISW